MKNIVLLFPSKPAKMLKTLIILAFPFFSSSAFSQNKQWHFSTDTLKLPTGIGNSQVSVGFYNRFDTVECRYKLIGDPAVQKGFKYVFILEGFYIDTPNTVNIFFDERKQRISSVEKFYFN